MTRIMPSQAPGLRRTWNQMMEFSPFKPGTALYLQIAEQIIEKIRQGRLQPRTVMPGSRELAAMLNVNRKTIVLSYDELIAQGWLTTQHRRGTFVSEALPYPAKTQLLPIPGEAFEFSTPALTASAPLSQPPALLMSEGLPDKRVIPYERYVRASKRAMAKLARTSVTEPPDYRGQAVFREAIASLLRDECGFNVSVEQLCLTRGLQQSIYISARALISPGDYVIFERWAPADALGVFESLGARILFADIDQAGARDDDIEALCRHHPVKAVFLTHQVQYPTTVSLTVARRRRLLQIAEELNFHIIAADYSQHLYFNQPAVPPVATGNMRRRIIYLGALPSVLPADRQVGYIANTPQFIDKCARQRQLMGQVDDPVSQAAITELIQTGEFHRMVRRVSRIYNQRRLHTAHLLSELPPSLLTFRLPVAGLFYWLNFPLPINTEAWSARLLQVGIQVEQPIHFAGEGTTIPGALLGYSHLDELQMEVLVHKLRDVMSSFLV
ncbi:MAG TPA: PLP-dependent aminotransferase family protein [Methylovorus sp.]|jgi:GntR family transcriptional regulator / MocR family aminotransferase|nr:PLP-dependent aminotransferase family protein [Methylovorus sp.]